MANALTLRTEMVPVLDKIYEREVLTSSLEVTDGPFIRGTANAKTVEIAKRSLQGLGDYARENGGTGFVKGDVSLTWESHTITHDRGREFNIDAVDNMESADLSFGGISQQFYEEYVGPEVDATRISTMAKAAIAAGNVATPATLSASTAVQAIDLAMKEMNDNKVPRGQRELYVSADVEMFINQSSLFVRNLDASNATSINVQIGTYNGVPVKSVPSDRFFTSIDFLDGSTAGQEDGGYVVTPTTGKAINFLLVHKPAVAGIMRHKPVRMFSPETNQDADSWKYQTRVYHDLLIFDNKINGIYVHNVA